MGNYVPVKNLFSSCSPQEIENIILPSRHFKSWQLYGKVTQDMLRTHEEKKGHSRSNQMPLTGQIHAHLYMRFYHLVQVPWSV